MTRNPLIAVLLPGALLAPAAAQAELKVVASFSILGDIVEQVAGDKASVATIVGPDADAHIYTPSVADGRAVTEADVIFVNGLGFETWSETLIESAGTDAPVFVANVPAEVETGRGWGRKTIPTFENKFCRHRRGLAGFREGLNLDEAGLSLTYAFGVS